MNDLMSRARMADQGSPQTPSQHAPQATNSKKSRSFSPMKLVSSVLLVATAILVLAILAFVVIGGGSTEADKIKQDQYQAIFLNDASGQVYFGKLDVMNARMYRLTDIYYVRVDTPVQPNTSNQTSQQNISLAKLGNELHGPEDEMFINRDAVLFWENLKEDGQVVTAIREFQKNGASTTNDQNQTQNNSSGDTNTTNSNSNSTNTNTNSNTTNR